MTATEDQDKELLIETKLAYGLTQSLQVSYHLGIPFGQGIEAKYKLCYGLFKCAVGMHYTVSALSLKGFDSNGDDEIELEVRDFKIPFYTSMRWRWLNPILCETYETKPPSGYYRSYHNDGLRCWFRNWLRLGWNGRIFILEGNQHFLSYRTAHHWHLLLSRTLKNTP